MGAKNTPGPLKRGAGVFTILKQRLLRSVESKEAARPENSGSLAKEKFGTRLL